MPITYYTELGALDARVYEIGYYLPETVDSSTALKVGANAGLNLEQMKKNAEDNLVELLKFLGYSATSSNVEDCLQQLNAKVREFHQTTFKLNGNQLETLIIDPYKIRMKEIRSPLKKEQWAFRHFLLTQQDQIAEAFIEIIVQRFESQLSTIGKHITNQIGKEIYQDLNPLSFDFTSNTVKIGKLGHIKSTGGTLIKSELLGDKRTDGTINYIVSQVSRQNFQVAKSNIINLMNESPEFSRRLLALAVKENVISSADIFTDIQGPTFKQTTTSNNNSSTMKFYFNIIDPFMNQVKNYSTDGIYAEKAAKKWLTDLQQNDPDQYNKTIDTLVKSTKDYLTPFFTSNGLDSARATQLKQYFDTAIENIIRAYPAVLFVGGNDKAITALVGEIQGLYYLYSIMGDNGIGLSQAQTLLSWIGGNTGFNPNNIKSGADIIGKIAEAKGFGFQIKNSTEDVYKELSLSDFSLNDDMDPYGFFNQLHNFGLTDLEISALEDILVMPSFNIGYHYVRHPEQRWAVQGDPEGPYAEWYNTTYDEILKLAAKAERFLSLVAVLIARIQFLQQSNFIQSNTIWFVGGVTVLTSVQILSQLIKQINNETKLGFNTRISNKYESGIDKKGNIIRSSFTIVEYLNKNGNLKNLKSTLHTSYNF